MDTLYEGKEVTAGFSHQPSGWDTAALANASFTMVNVEDFDINRDVKVFDVPGSHGNKNVNNNNIILNAQGSMGQFPINGPLSVYEFDWIAACFFQNVIENNTTPNTKDFVPFAIHPDFPNGTYPNDNDTGYFLTWCKRFPVASTSWMMYNCICHRLKVSGEKNGMIMFESDWVGKGTPSVTFNPSGTWTANSDETNSYGYKFFNDMTAATLIFSDYSTTEIPITLQSFEFEMQYENESTGQDGAGGFLTYGLHTRSGTMSLKMLKDSAAELALANQTSNAAIDFNVRWGAAGAPAARNLHLTGRGKMSDLTVDTDGLLNIDISVQMSADVGEEMFQISLANSIDRGWPNS